MSVQQWSEQQLAQFEQTMRVAMESDRRRAATAPDVSATTIVDREPITLGALDGANPTGDPNPAAPALPSFGIPFIGELDGGQIALLGIVAFAIWREVT